MDDSERQSLLQQIAQLQQQLTEAQKLTAIGEIASTTTHEFNNVLTTIINYAKMGVRHRDEPTRNKAFEKILAAGQRAAKVTNSVLGFARNRSAGQEPTDMTKLVEDSLLLLEREMARYRIAVDVRLADVPRALVNGNQIQQVLINLLVNARQAMLEGGSLLVKLAYDETQGMVEVTVRDSGSGIAPDKLPRIFDRFFTTKSGPDATGKGGTGLGLAFCRDIIEAHQGRIHVASTVGKGTQFTLKLPAAPAAKPVQPENDQAITAVADSTLPAGKPMAPVASKALLPIAISLPSAQR